MKRKKFKYISVAIALPLNDPFTYKMADYAVSEALLGCRVLVPFKNRKMVAYVVAINPTPLDISKVKEVIERIDTEPALDANMLKLTYWVSQYYLCSWGEAIESTMPAYLKKKLLPFNEISIRKSKTDIVLASFKPDAFKLNSEQKKAFEAVCKSIDENKFSTKLLYGVTGSGKTEVYIRAIKKVLEAGKTAICLFPEIALTRHLQQAFCNHFKGDLVIVHSNLSAREKFIAWRAIKNNEKTVVIGPRSAVFMPLRNPGIIIVDEEHENTYKQNDTPRYHTVKVAKQRMLLENGVLLLGGATPSIETMAAAKFGEIELLSLKKRIADRPMPDVKIIDMREELYDSKIVLISQYLKLAIERTMAEKAGVLLFLNRRGFSTSVSCSKCGEVIQCDKCRLAFTYHQTIKRLLCHYCDKQIVPPERCPTCGNANLKYGGVGTQKVESLVARLFPQAKVERLDTDSVKKKGVQEKIIADFKNGKIDILIGTQMITKGFNFPHVKLVGVINADTVLALPDFRSSERTFQLLTQVAGRAGRGDLKGEVIIQTFSPDNYAIQTAKKHDFEKFYECEIRCRKELKYPPFSQLANLIVRSTNEESVKEYCISIKARLMEFSNKYKLNLLGPAPLPFYNLRGYFRWHFMFKGVFHTKVLVEMKLLVFDLKQNRTVQIACDIDPVNIL